MKTWQELQKMAEEMKKEDIGFSNILLQLALARKADEEVFTGIPVVETVISNEIQLHIDKIYHPEKEIDKSDYEDWLENGQKNYRGIYKNLLGGISNKSIKLALAHSQQIFISH